MSNPNFQEWTAFLERAGIPHCRCTQIGQKFVEDEKTVVATKNRYSKSKEEAESYLSGSFNKLLFADQNDKNNELRNQFWQDIFGYLEIDKHERAAVAALQIPHSTPVNALDKQFSRLSLTQQEQPSMAMKTLLNDYLGDDSDLNGFQQLSISNDSALEKIKGIVSKQLGFKIRVDSSPFKIACLLEDSLMQYVEIGLSTPEESIFEYELRQRASSILFHSSDWTFRSSEHGNIPIYASLFDQVLTLLSRLESSLIITTSRNVTENTATSQSLRPDFICFANTVLFFKGEEKPEPRLLQTAISELSDKFDKQRAKVSYRRLPILFGYAAAGNLLALAAIQVSDLVYDRFKQPRCKVLAHFDLTKPLHRINLLVNVINIFRVLKHCTRCELIVSDRSLNLFSRIDKGNTSVTNMLNFVRKTMTIDPQDISLSKIDYKSLFKVYAKLKGISLDNANITKVIKYSYNNTDNQVVLHIKPVCYARVITQIGELLCSIRDILKALNMLHNLNIIHRDIRWSNVLYDAIRSRFLLTDFEHSCVLPDDRAYVLVNNEFRYIPIEMLEAHETGHSLFTKQADILMLGLMVKRLANSDISFQVLEQITIEIEDREILKIVHELGEKIISNWKTIKISDILEEVNRMIQMC